MRGVVIVSEELRAQIARDLTEMAVTHRESLAARIRADHFESVVDAVARDIRLEFPDQEAALIASLSRCRVSLPEAFIRRRSRPGAFSIFRKGSQ